MGSVMKSDEKKTVLAYLCVCIFWGSTYLAIRIGVSEFPPALFAGFRFLIAGALMVGFAKFKGLEFPKKAIDIKKISLVGVLLLAGGNGLVVWAEQWVHSGIACLFVATVPLYMATIEMLLPGRKKLSLKGWIGLIIGFSGVILLVFTNSGSGSIDLKGLILLLCGPLLWSAGSVFSKSFKAAGSLVPQIGIQMLAGGLLLTIVGLSIGEAEKISLTIKGVGAILYLALFGSVLAYSCYIYILQKWPASKAGTYAYVNPPVALLLGSVVLGEPFTIQIVLSSFVILTGVFLVQTAKVKVQSHVEEQTVERI